MKGRSNQKKSGDRDKYAMPLVLIIGSHLVDKKRGSTDINIVEAFHWVIKQLKTYLEVGTK